LRKDREASERKWEKNERKWEEARKADAEKWEEQNRKWEENERKWEENQEELKKLREEQERKWQESRQDFKEEMEKSRKYFDLKLNATLGAIGSRWGIRTEASYRNALKGILEEVAPDLEVIHFEDFDSEGMVYDRPGTVELDVIIKNGLLMLCELKSSMSRADMFAFYKKAKFYERKQNRKGDRLIVISPMVEDQAKKVADELGVKIYSFAWDMEEELTG